MDRKIFQIINEHTKGKLTLKERRNLNREIIDVISQRDSKRAGDNAIILGDE